MNSARRRWLLAAVSASLPAAGLARPAAPLQRVDVWMSAGCACCRGWAGHLAREGFGVRVLDPLEPSARERLGVPLRHASCHTARVEGYVLEGHVSVREIRRLLRERPPALGLAVPGMPIGAPGIDDPVYRGRRDPHDVLLLLAGGGTQVFERYR